MDEIEQLVARLETYNRAYRNGQPLISDGEYDQLVETLRQMDPRHPYLNTVEPEQFAARSEIRHPTPMLSIEKVYIEKPGDIKRLRRFVDKVNSEAAAIGMDHPQFQVTAKLDGLAGRDNGDVFATRGNGLVGYEISSAFDKGVVPVGGRGQGLGEIVVIQSYFNTHLSDKFEHPRNMVVGIVSSDTLNEDAIDALKAGMVRFVPYRQLPARKMNGETLLAEIETIFDDLMAESDYPLDGIVVSAIGEELKASLGATAHHYRWQIAVKRKGQTAKTTVEKIHWQVGRTGNVTPVLEVAAVALSGATIRRVTAHHAGMVGKLHIGPGARIEVIRSGEVIPKLEQVITPSDDVTLPERCPACKHPLDWKGDFLRCENTACPAQIEQRISHWFRILGSADWFGIKSIQKLVDSGYDSLEKIYAMDRDDFVAVGFGPIQSKNLADALAISRTKPVEEWRFLAAFGIPDLGIGDSRKLLQHLDLEDILNIDKETLQKIKGFGEEKSRSIPDGVAAIRPLIEHMLALSFNLQPTIKTSESTPPIDSPIAGKKLVFSGKMAGGSRTE
ncbi:MAG: helix-hairpin-helix domain-containing protein, partial [Desulfobacteraceae bacterium]